MLRSSLLIQWINQRSKQKTWAWLMFFWELLVGSTGQPSYAQPKLGAKPQSDSESTLSRWDEQFLCRFRTNSCSNTTAPSKTWRRARSTSHSAGRWETLCHRPTGSCLQSDDPQWCYRLVNYSIDYANMYHNWYPSYNLCSGHKVFRRRLWKISVVISCVCHRILVTSQVYFIGWWWIMLSNYDIDQPGA